MKFFVISTNFVIKNAVNIFELKGHYDNKDTKAILAMGVDSITRNIFEIIEKGKYNQECLNKYNPDRATGEKFDITTHSVALNAKPTFSPPLTLA